jgi:hypothetical protein
MLEAFNDKIRLEFTNQDILNKSVAKSDIEKIQVEMDLLKSDFGFKVQLLSKKELEIQNLNEKLKTIFQYVERYTSIM